jgi:hypothetical protein
LLKLNKSSNRPISPLLSKAILASPSTWSMNRLPLAIQESEQLATMALFAAVEASLQIDYHNRVRRRIKKGKSLRQLYKKIHQATTHKKLQAPPVQWLLDSWKQVLHQSAQLGGNLLAAFRYRHWLAHGRYWVFRGNAISHDLLFSLVSRFFKALEASEPGFHLDPLQKP